MKRVILIIFALVFAYWFHDTLTSIVFFLPVDEISFIIGKGILGGTSLLTVGEWVQVGVWAILLYFILPWTLNLFGFIRPRAALFSDTKLFRYPQRIMFEVVLVALALGIALIVAAIIDTSTTDLTGSSWYGIVGQFSKYTQALIDGDYLTEDAKAYVAIGAIIIGVSLLVVYAIMRDFFTTTVPNLLPIFDRAKVGRGGASGRFTGYLEEHKAEFNPKKSQIYLGRSLFTPFLKVGIEDERHMLTVAGTRSGKGTSVIIPNLLTWEENAVVIDPKGTSTIVAHKRRKELRNNVIVVDPYGITGIRSAVFNPMDLLDVTAETVGDDIRLIADALVIRDKSSKDQHWDDGARTILAGLIAHIATFSGFRDKSLPMLRTLITLPPDQKAKLWKDMLKNTAASNLAVTAANRILSGAGTSEIQNILSNADKHTEWLESPAIQRALTGGNAVNFAAMRREKTTVFFVIPIERLETQNRFTRLFVNTLIKNYIKGGKPERKTLFIMDEFLSLGYMKEVENAMTWAAGFNLYLWPFIQDFGTFEDLYGAKTNAFLTNSRAVQVFGVDDKATNNFVSEKMGKRGLTGLMNIQRSNETAPLREPSEVGLDIEASSKRQFILRTGKPTMLLERTDYYDSLYFKGKFQPDPEFKGDKPLEWAQWKL